MLRIFIFLIINFSVIANTDNVIESVASCGQQHYLPSTVQANDKEIYQDYELTFVKSPNPNGPVVVDLGLFIIEVTEVNEISNTFRVEGYLDLIWCDPREAFDKDSMPDNKVFLEENANLKLEKIWWPELNFVNQASPREIDNQLLIIYHDGTIRYEERFDATLEANFNLLKFPFDSQLLEMEIESFTWTNRDLVFNENKDKIGFANNFKIPEWTVNNVNIFIGNKQEIRDREPFSEFSIYISISRESGFYLFKILLPLVLIIATSWSIFWLPYQELANRIHISLAVVLSVVAYQFVVSGNLPKIPYFTTMDNILIVSFEFIVLTIIQSIIVNKLYLNRNSGLALKLDIISRIVIPVLYLAIVSLILVFH